MTGTPRERAARSRWPVRRIHKWMSVAVGACIFTWVVSGLVIIAPVGTRTRPAATARPDFSVMAVSPAQAVAAARAAHPGAEVTNLTMRRLGPELAFQVTLRGAGAVLVDARTAQLVSVTPELAARLVLEGLPAGATVARVERVERRQFGYFGPLPAFRVDIADDALTRGFVSVSTGEVVRTDRAGRLRLFVGSFHEFFPLEWLSGGELIRPWLLWITSLVAIAIVLTGYWISLPRKARQSS